VTIIDEKKVEDLLFVVSYGSQTIKIYFRFKIKSNPMRLFLLFSIILFNSNLIRSQESIEMYKSASLSFYSHYWNDSIQCQLAIPVSYSTNMEQDSMPLLLLFDQQNSTSFNYHLRSINFLTGAAAQIPELLVAGIPFPPNKRFWLTDSDPRTGDSISGIERTAKMLFEELIPTFEKRYPAVNYLIIAGHSRTGWLVNYLLAHYPENVNAAGSFSSFFETEEVIAKLVKLAQNEKGNSHYFFMTAGNSFEEQTYMTQLGKMAERLDTTTKNPRFRWSFQVLPNVNHITNFGLSLPIMLTDLFIPYNKILGSWFAGKQDSLRGLDAVNQLIKDFEQLPYPIHPQLLHWYSLTSHYYNTNDYETARLFLEVGLEYYPDEPGLMLFMAEVLQLQQNTEEALRYLENFEKLMKTQDFIKGAEMDELWDWYESLN